MIVSFIKKRSYPSFPQKRCGKLFLQKNDFLHDFLLTKGKQNKETGKETSIFGKKIYRQKITKKQAQNDTKKGKNSA